MACGRARQRVYRTRYYRAAHRSDNVAVEAYDIGLMECECRHCGTLFFAEEVIKCDGTFTMCCMRGKVHLPPLGECRQLLHHMLTGDSNDCNNYRQFIRKYNAALTFVSLCADVIVKYPRCSLYTFQIQGQVHHQTSGAACPPDDKDPWYNKLYFNHVDAVNAARSMHQVMAAEEEDTWQKDRPSRQVTLTIKPDLGRYPNVYELPATVKEFAAIFVSDVLPMNNYIRIYPKDRPVQFISLLIL
ncbi:hypothetical protein PR048_012026 [Dryococelus australis]|uniref:Uncharacterized protein n=1 Tax=Dryococelus australis TaxID=614101 RepID=A0ABQ9HNA6_9NEOP|nr:hypothetical protein PR048_012026 [Dryococelus australis]